MRSPGCNLMNRSGDDCQRERERAVPPSPGNREDEQQDRANGAHLDREQEGPARARQSEGHEPDVDRHGQDRDGREHAGDADGDPGPGREGRGQRRQGQHEREERGRVLEDAALPGRRDRDVVWGVTGDQPPRRAVVGEVVATERVRGVGEREEQVRAEDGENEADRDPCDDLGSSLARPSHRGHRGFRSRKATSRSARAIE